MMFLFVGSQLCARASFRQLLTKLPLPSANVWGTIIGIVTGFTHRGLSPHKFMPMPGVHLGFQQIAAKKRPLLLKPTLYLKSKERNS